MEKTSLIMMLLPIVFVVHEYEEIIMFRRWIDRNREELRKRFPKLESLFTRRGHLDYSTTCFCRWYFSRVYPNIYCFMLFRMVRGVSMVVWCIDWIFCSSLDAYRTMDCVSKICACYHH